MHPLPFEVLVERHAGQVVFHSWHENRELISVPQWKLAHRYDCCIEKSCMFFSCHRIVSIFLCMMPTP